MKIFQYSLALSIIALSAFFSSCSSTDAQTEQIKATSAAAPVTVQEIQPVSFTDALSITGIVKASEDVLLSPEEGGVVKEWKAQKGQYVKKGEIIALLKDDVLQPGYDAAAAQYKLTQLNFEKQTKVYSEQGISELQMKSTEFNRDAAKAQAELMNARLERSRLRSPINGILNDRFFDEGEFAPPAVPIAHLVNSAVVKITAEVPETYAGRIQIGSPVVYTVDAYPLDTLRGKVTYLSAAINPNNRTMLVEAMMTNVGNRLKPEMIARVKILRSNRTKALMINESYVQLVDRSRFIVFVERDGKAVERVVKLGARQGNKIEILEGLNAGDRLITAGFQKLVNGQSVSVTS